MTGRFRVLVVNDLPPDGGPGSGGAEVYMRRLIAGLRDAGDDVSVFTRSGPRSAMSKPLAMWDPLTRRALRARVREFRPDVVHVHNVLRELSASVFGAVADVPTVMTVHDLRLVGVTMGTGSAARNALDRLVKQPLDTALARRHVDIALPVSAEIAGRLRAAGFAQVREVPAPAPSPVTATTPPSTSTTVLFVGRLSADKGVDVLLDAWPDVSAAVPAADLVVVGDGPERTLLAQRADLLDGVQFTGRLDELDVSRALGSARVVAVPSLPAVRPEGAPLVVVEAATHGRPVVTSDDAGLVELVDRLGHGVITPAGDPQSLAAALVTVLTDDGLADRLGGIGAARAAEHAPERVVSAVREAYADAIRGGR